MAEPEIQQQCPLKVIGVGKAGADVINHMVMAGLPSIEFIAVDGDSDVLAASLATYKITLDTGSQLPLSPQVHSQISAAIGEAWMVVLVADMGGKIGCELSPCIAKLAKSLGAFTPAVVLTATSEDKPLQFTHASEAMRELLQHADGVVAIPLGSQIPTANVHGMGILGEGQTQCKQEKGIESLCAAVDCLYSLVLRPGLIGVDVADIRVMMTEQTLWKIGTGEASGCNRAQEATTKAIQSLFACGVTLSNSSGAIFTIAGDDGLSIEEISAAAEIIQILLPKDANILFQANHGAVVGGSVRVSLLTTESSVPEDTNATNIEEEGFISDDFVYHDDAHLISDDVGMVGVSYIRKPKKTKLLVNVDNVVRLNTEYSKDSSNATVFQFNGLGQYKTAARDNSTPLGTVSLASVLEYDGIMGCAFILTNAGPGARSTWNIYAFDCVTRAVACFRKELIRQCSLNLSGPYLHAYIALFGLNGLITQQIDLAYQYLYEEPSEGILEKMAVLGNSEVFGQDLPDLSASAHSLFNALVFLFDEDFPGTEVEEAAEAIRLMGFFGNTAEEYAEFQLARGHNERLWQKQHLLHLLNLYEKMNKLTDNVLSVVERC